MYKAVIKEIEKISKKTGYSEEFLTEIAEKHEYWTDEKTGRKYNNVSGLIIDCIKDEIREKEHGERQHELAETDIAEYFDCEAVMELLNNFGYYLGMPRRGMSLDEFQNELHTVLRGLRTQLEPIKVLAEMKESA